LAREQLVEILLRDLLELQAELGGDLGNVPEDVAELLGDRRAALVGDEAAVVADRLLGVLCDLARLAGEAERRVGQPGLPRVRGRAARALLVVR